jgi:SOS-response transcriptional repressor LexA
MSALFAQPNQVTVGKSGKPAIERVFDFILKYKHEHDGNSPSFREIGEACGISSTAVVSYWLKRLETQGLILLPEDPGAHTNRRIEVVGGCWMMEGCNE